MANIFAAGRLWGIPTVDYQGNAITVPTPVQFGTLQDISIDFGFDIKKLYGTKQFPDDIARGKGTITGKASTGKVNGALLNSLFFGQTLTAGQLNDYTDLTGTAVPTTPFTITPTPPSSGVWASDLGVTGSTGVPLTRVASGPTAGQYSVAAGVYTFAAADVALVMYINYNYTATSTTASKGTMVNPFMGSTPAFQAEILLPGSTAGVYTSFTMLKCVSNKLTIATKLDDYAIPSLSWECSADSFGNFLKWSTSN